MTSALCLHGSLMSAGGRAHLFRAGPGQRQLDDRGDLPDRGAHLARYQSLVGLRQL